MSFGRRLRTMLCGMEEKIGPGSYSKLIEQGWVKTAQDRKVWDKIVRQYCKIRSEFAHKNETLMEHIEGRPYGVKFRNPPETRNSVSWLMMILL